MSARRGDIIDGGDAAPVPKPPWLQERLGWFQDLKLGLFLHWGVYAQWDCLSLIHISEPTRLWSGSRMPSSA